MFDVSSVQSSILITSLGQRELVGRFDHLTSGRGSNWSYYCLVTVFYFSSVLSSILITSLVDEGGIWSHYGLVTVY